MKILNAEQLKIVDKQTIQEEGIHFHSIDLMERAAMAVFKQMHKDVGTSGNSFIVLCGNGNNGGDGLAIARILSQRAAEVTVFLLPHEVYAPDNILNQHELMEEEVEINPLNLNEVVPIPSDSIVIDALFGCGLSRPLSPEWKPLTDHINAAPNTVIAIDMPSGLMADQRTDKGHPIIHADYTYTFQTAKLSLIQPENALYTGHVSILNIGLSAKAIARQHTNYYFITQEEIQPMLKEPLSFSHKGTFGHSFIVGGSFGKIGAVILSSKAALRTGCGLVSSYIPRCGYTILQTAFPEAMVLTDEAEDCLSFPPEDLSPYTALGIGIGMGTSIESQKFLHNLLANINQQPTKPAIVLDADALNMLAMHPDWLNLIPAETIFTPHPKELERLIGPWQNDDEKLQKAQQFAHSYQSILLIKGAYTVVIPPHGPLYFNSTGNWGMATAGSGDVLTGIITSLLAQGFQAKQAAILGVFLHGTAGDIAAQNGHPKSLIASDIIENLAVAWLKTYTQKLDKKLQ